MARESIDPTSEVMAALRDELVATKQSLDELREQSEAFELEAEREQAMLRVDLENATNTNRQTQAELDEWRTKYADKEAEIQYLQTELELAATEKAELKNRVNVLELAGRELESLNLVTIHQQKGLERKLEGYEDRITRLEYELTRANSETDSLKDAASTTPSPATSLESVSVSVSVSDGDGRLPVSNETEDVVKRIKGLEAYVKSCYTNLEPLLQQMSHS